MANEMVNAHPLREIGWKPWFEQQVSLEEAGQVLPARVSAHWGSRVLCCTEVEELSLPSQLIERCGDVAVGDWLLLDPSSHRGIRRLQRQSLIARKAPGEKMQTQLIAANLDTLFILTSCNHDFNLSRLERYLAVAIEADVTPVVVLTKADLSESSAELRQQAGRLRSGLVVETIDARDPQQVNALLPWCQSGQTVAMVGSSGVGKSTLAITLGAGNLPTQEIREDDSKGRHTTTARSMYRLTAGGLLIDNPGMRELQLADCEEGVQEVFEEIIELARLCRFRDCSHRDEPGCAVQASIAAGELDPRRLKSYRKLLSEQARNAESLRTNRSRERKQGQFYKTVQASKRQRRDRREEF